VGSLTSAAKGGTSLDRCRPRSRNPRRAWSTVGRRKSRRTSRAYGGGPEVRYRGAPGSHGSRLGADEPRGGDSVLPMLSRAICYDPRPGDGAASGGWLRCTPREPPVRRGRGGGADGSRVEGCLPPGSGAHSVGSLCCASPRRAGSHRDYSQPQSSRVQRVQAYGANATQIIPPADAAIAELIDHAPPASSIARSEQVFSGGHPDLHPTRPRDIRGLLGRGRSTAAADAADRRIRIAYTPLHGVGGAYVKQALLRAGFSDLHVVPEQAEPDPDFPTAQFPIRRSPDTGASASAGPACGSRPGNGE